MSGKKMLCAAATAMVLVVLLGSTTVVAQEIILFQDFSQGIPTSWQQFTGSSLVQAGALRLNSGCLILPDSYQRSGGLRIDADINVNWQAAGDFNIFVFFDPLAPPAPHCFYPTTDGYDFSYYPVGSDNTFDAIRSTVQGSRSDLSTGPPNLLANTWHHISAEVLPDGTLRHLVDGELRLVANDANHSEGPVVLRTWGSVLIDNFQITTLCSYGLPDQPMTVERHKGPPVWETVEWQSCGGSGVLAVGVDSVTSALVYLNGELLFGPGDFDATVDLLTASVSLEEGLNILDVQARGKPGSSLAFHFQPSE